MSAGKSHLYVDYMTNACVSYMTYMYICEYAHAWVDERGKEMCVCVKMCAEYVCMHVCMRICVCMHIYIYIYIYILYERI